MAVIGFIVQAPSNGLCTCKHQITWRHNFNIKFVVFANCHCQRRRQYLLYSRLCKYHIKPSFLQLHRAPQVLSGNTKGGSINIPLTSCLTGLDQSVLQIKTKIVSCHTADSKPVKQEVNSTEICPPLVFPSFVHGLLCLGNTSGRKNIAQQMSIVLHVGECKDIYGKSQILQLKFKIWQRATSGNHQRHGFFKYLFCGQFCSF